MRKLGSILIFALGLLWIKDIHARLGKALVLDGRSNYIEISDNDSLDFQSEISIEVWVQPNCDDMNRIVVSKQWCSGEFAYYLSLNNGSFFWSYSNSGFCTSPNTVQTNKLLAS